MTPCAVPFCLASGHAVQRKSRRFSSLGPRAGRLSGEAFRVTPPVVHTPLVVCDGHFLPIDVERGNGDLLADACRPKVFVEPSAVPDRRGWNPHHTVRNGGRCGGSGLLRRRRFSRRRQLARGRLALCLRATVRALARTPCGELERGDDAEEKLRLMRMQVRSV